MDGLILAQLCVVRDGTTVLDDVSLSVGSNDICALLGPSGSGKTSLLRAVAGLDEVADGQVLLDGEDVTFLQTRDRELALVTETATMQPHLDVGENIAFPLRLQRLPDEEVDRRVEAEARAFSVRRLLRRSPSQVSAGERHAAATAHGLVRLPRVILMDEPVAQIDQRLRAEALRQVVAVQSGYGVPMLIATNDPSVAATIATMVAVLDRGRIRQVGTFADLYDDPTDLITAEVTGLLPLNLLAVRSRPGHIEVAGTTFPAPGATGPVARSAVRPEQLEIVAEGDEDAVDATVDRTSFAGARAHVHATADDGSRLLATARSPGPKAGVRVGLRPRRLHLFDDAGRRVGVLTP